MEIWIRSGDDLERERRLRGLTATALAELAGLSGASHVRQIERGLMDPRLSTVLKLTAALKAIPARKGERSRGSPDGAR